MNVNTLEMEWTDAGCMAVATGFKGVMLTCPRCQAELLPRGTTHRCGNRIIEAMKHTPRKRRKP